MKSTGMDDKGSWIEITRASHRKSSEKKILFGFLVNHGSFIECFMFFSEKLEVEKEETAYFY